MSYGAQSTRYLENDILSRPKEWLVPLLFEHLVTHLKRAQVLIEVDDRAGWSRSLVKAQAIAFELLGTLNRQVGGEIVERLSSIYGFWISELLEVQNAPKESGTRLADIADMAGELGEAFTRAAEEIAPRGAKGRLSVAYV